MKLCPKCNRANDEIDDRCIFCDGSLADAEPTLWADPWEDWSDYWVTRREKVRKEIIYASLVYVVEIDLVAMCMGAASGSALVWFSLSALLVAFGIGRGTIGRLPGMLLQCMISAMVFFGVGDFTLYSVYAIGGHAIVAMVFYIWAEGLRET